MSNVSETSAAGVSQSSPHRRWLRPRFSLAALFGVMTLACVGVWYWYQWPYEVEHLTYSSGPGPREVIRHEVETVRNVWSRERKTIRHGRWIVYDGQGNKLQEGRYRNGAKHGAFIDYDGQGNKQREEHFESGVRHGLSRRWEGKQLVAERNFDRGQLHGPFLLSGGHWSVTGSWKQGAAEGMWNVAEKNSDTNVTIRFEAGRVLDVQPDLIDPYLIRSLAGATADVEELQQSYERTLTSLFRNFDVEFVEMPLIDAIEFMAIGSGIAIVRSSDADRAISSAGRAAAEQARAASVADGVERQPRNPEHDPSVGMAAADSSSPLSDDDLRRVLVSCKVKRAPTFRALRDMLRQNGLAADFRYGVIWITTTERAGDPDASGVEQIVPPSGSRLARCWDEPRDMEFIKKPVREVIGTLESDQQVKFDTSRLPADFDSSELTMNIRGIAFKDCLGQFLDRVSCRASLEGETIVIEPLEEQ